MLLLEPITVAGGLGYQIVSQVGDKVVSPSQTL